MSPQTRRQTQQLEYDDRVDKGATMYPAFVTAPVPVEILNMLVDDAREGALALTDGEGPPHGCLCILITKDLDSTKHGSRRPMEPFRSPFLGMTDDEVRSWMCEHRHPHFAYSTFAVLDEDTAENKTCRIGYSGINQEEAIKMITTDFFVSMHIRIPLEMATISWCEEVWGKELRAGTDGVYDRRCIEEEGEVAEVAEVV